MPDQLISLQYTMRVMGVHEWPVTCSSPVLTESFVAVLSSVERMADACTAGVVTVAIVAGTATRDIWFSIWSIWTRKKVQCI